MNVLDREKNIGTFHVYLVMLGIENESLFCLLYILSVLDKVYASRNILLLQMMFFFHRHYLRIKCNIYLSAR